MNVILMMRKVFRVPDSVIRESALPDFALATEDLAESMRIRAFDQLDRVLDRNVVGRSDQQMNVFGHHDERMNLETSFAAVSIESLKKQSNIILDDEQPASLPCRECHKVSSGRRDESSRLQDRTSAAEAALL